MSETVGEENTEMVVEFILENDPSTSDSLLIACAFLKTYIQLRPDYEKKEEVKQTINVLQKKLENKYIATKLKEVNK